MAIANYKNNTATRGARCQALVNGTGGGTVGETNAEANDLMTLSPVVETAAITGTATIQIQYRAEGAGTVTARDISVIAVGERTS